MNIEQYTNSIIEDIKKLPKEKGLSYVKMKIASIPDENDRKVAEIFFTLGAASGNNESKLVVVLIHGIRTYATWQELIRNRLEPHDVTDVYPIGYGYLDVFSFLCPFFTRKPPVDRVLRELRGIQRKHRNDKICVIAHSFGTYIISKILIEHPDVQLDRLLLCGSVIPFDFKWDNLAAFPSNGVINDCGNKDIWPILAGCVTWGYGASGTFGFKTHKVVDRFHNFGHGDFFNIDFIDKFWIPFILDAKRINSIWGETKRQTPPYIITMLTWIPIKTILIISVILLYSPELTGLHISQIDFYQIYNEITLFIKREASSFRK
jgi:pimeloyl-ACP methyl ester carboxylesterase